MRAGEREWEEGGERGGEGEGQAQDEDADRDMERSWYDQEEGGHAVDDSHNPFVGDETLFKKREEAMVKRVNHRREARLRDADRWAVIHPDPDHEANVSHSHSHSHGRTLALTRHPIKI